VVIILENPAFPKKIISLLASIQLLNSARDVRCISKIFLFSAQDYLFCPYMVVKAFLKFNLEIIERQNREKESETYKAAGCNASNQ